MFIAPTRRSVTARLDNRIWEILCNSFFRFIAMITNAFKRILTREAMGAMGTKIQGIMISFKCHTKPGLSGQMNTDLILEEELAAL